MLAACFSNLRYILFCCLLFMTGLAKNLTVLDFTCPAQPTWYDVIEMNFPNLQGQTA
jgi:hypothetical protein